MIEDQLLASFLLGVACCGSFLFVMLNFCTDTREKEDKSDRADHIEIVERQKKLEKARQTVQILEQHLQNQKSKQI